MSNISRGLLRRLAGWLMVILIGGQMLGWPPTPALAQRDRSAPVVPWTVTRPNYEVEVVASGFQLPVNIAFVPNPRPEADSPVTVPPTV